MMIHNVERRELKRTRDKLFRSEGNLPSIDVQPVSRDNRYTWQSIWNKDEISTNWTHTWMPAPAPKFTITSRREKDQKAQQRIHDWCCVQDLRKKSPEQVCSLCICMIDLSCRPQTWTNPRPCCAHAAVLVAHNFLIWTQLFSACIRLLRKSPDRFMGAYN